MAEMIGLAGKSLAATLLLLLLLQLLRQLQLLLAGKKLLKVSLWQPVSSSPVCCWVRATIFFSS
jgi:hypothetical protein